MNAGGSMVRLPRWIVLWVFALMLGCPLLAHGLRLEVQVDAQARVVGAVFSGSHPVKGAQVRFLDPAQKVLGATHTDEQGAFSFAMTQRCDLTVVASEGAHRVERQIPRTAFPSQLPETESPASLQDEAALTRVVEAAVARRVNPLERALQRQEAALRFRDILGGLGYILGIAGLGFYLTGRAKR